MATSTQQKCNRFFQSINRDRQLGDFFERPSVLIKYEGSFDQDVFPHMGCRVPQLDFFVTAENKNCIDLNRICLSLEVCLYQPDGTEKVKPADVELTFANNTLHSLFSHVEMFLNGKLTSSRNNNYHHLGFIETELITDIASKRTWAPVNVLGIERMTRQIQKHKRKSWTNSERANNSILNCMEHHT